MEGLPDKEGVAVIVMVGLVVTVKDGLPEPETDADKVRERVGVPVCECVGLQV